MFTTQPLSTCIVGRLFNWVAAVGCGSAVPYPVLAQGLLHEHLYSFLPALRSASPIAMRIDRYSHISHSTRSV